MARSIVSVSASGRPSEVGDIDARARVPPTPVTSEAWTAAVQGRLVRAEALVRAAAIELGESRVVPRAHLALAVVARDRNQLDRAREEVGLAVRTGGAAGQAGTVALARLEGARLSSLAGDHVRAIGAVVDVTRSLPTGERATALGADVDEVDVMVHLAAGDADRAEAIVERMDPGRRRDLAAVRVALARDEADQALRQALDLLGAAELTLRDQVVAGLVAVRAELEVGGVQEPRRRLAAVAALVTPEGMVGPYLELGLEPPPGLSRDIPPWLSLTVRERQVLRHLVNREDNREIGRAMNISVNTVKTHLQSIYRKLGVETRRAAVEKGAELGLVGRAHVA